MKLYIDTANLDEIREASKWGIIDGVTTNPSLMAKTGKSTVEIVKEIVTLINGPISAEVNSQFADEMIKEGKNYAEIHPNITIKLPMTIEGIKACKWFAENKIKTNITLVFSANQALIAAKAGATFVSPFIGRLDDLGHDGLALISEIRTIYDNFGFETKILSASIRSHLHVRDVALSGSDIATVPFKILKGLYSHPLTDKGLAQFLKDYKNSSKNVL